MLRCFNFCIAQRGSLVMSYSSQPFVRLERKFNASCGIGIITLSRKAQKNAVDKDTAEQLLRAVKKIENDDKLSCGSAARSMFAYPRSPQVCCTVTMTRFVAERT